VSQSALLLSLFWAGLLAGRFGVPPLYHGPRQDLVTLCFSALATVAIAALSLFVFAPEDDVGSDADGGHEVVGRSGRRRYGCVASP